MASRKIERRLVVVGVDGSAQSVAAPRWAARYAAATGAVMRAIPAWLGAFCPVTVVRGDEAADAGNR
jgi:hypothetical protein